MPLLRNWRKKPVTKNSEKRVPALRFKGFTNDWEQCKLGEVTQRVQGNDNNMNRPVLTISAKTGWMTQSNRFSSIIAGSEKKKYTLLKKGELSYNHGNSKIAPFGTVFMLNNYSEALVPKVYHSFKANYYMNPYFLELYFHTKKLDPQLRKFISSSARMDGLLNITYKWFEKIFIFSPQLSEQNKLEKIFLLINKYISLQQRKLELLSLIKKTIIKHLFKLKNSDSLNLKFKTSCSQWNSKKLGEIAKFINGRAFKQAELLNKGKYPVLRVGNFYTNDKWFYSDLNLNKNKYADKGDLLYTWSATFGPHIWKGSKVIFHYHIWKIDFDPSTVNKTFLFYFLEADKENLLTNSNGSTMIHITKSNMENKIINLPQFSIQQNIGTFLSNLDYLINQVKIKSKQLIQLKRFLLQNMFI